MSEEKFESWAIIELFGHSRIAGLISEQTIGGTSFIRVDVPEVDGCQPFTRFLGNGAIYSMTPVSEQIARLAAEKIQDKPIHIYMPEIIAQFPAPEAQMITYPSDRDNEAADWEEEDLP